MFGPHLLITGEALFTLIKGISRNTGSIHKIMTNLYNNNNHKYLIEILEELDFSSYLKVIEPLISEVQEKYNNESVIPSSISNSIQSLNSVINDIYIKLVELDEAVQYHNTKFLCQYRYPSYYHKIDVLKKKKVILKERVDLFLKVSNVNNVM